ncbi:MAG: ATP-binding protein [Pseudonocardia sp.]|nr:ATP-binding protein [Pseudonocardia sp.]
MSTSQAVEPVTTCPAPSGSARGRDLVGRAAERDVLHTFLDDAAARGGALVLTGESGVGKTALLAAAADRARSGGAAVLSVSGDASSGVPFGDLAGLVRPVRHALHRLDRRCREALCAAVGPAALPSPDRLLVRTAAMALLRSLGRERPHLVVVDDLQDLDHESATALAFVARRLAGSHVGLLAAARTGDDGAVPVAGLARLPVLPLPDADAGRLVREHVPGLPEHLVRPVLIDGAGNPLALRELAATRARTWFATRPDAAADVPSRCPAGAAHAAAHGVDPADRAALRMRAVVLADPARVSRREATALDAAIRSLPAEPDPFRVTRVAALGLALDRVEQCRAPLRRVLHAGRDGRAVTAAMTASALLCAGGVATGRWDEAADLADEGGALCEQHGHRLAAAPLRLAQGLVAAARGDEMRTHTLLERGRVGRAARRPLRGGRGATGHGPGRAGARRPRGGLPACHRSHPRRAARCVRHRAAGFGRPRRGRGAARSTRRGTPPRAGHA